jgi:hypothetical protein
LLTTSSPQLLANPRNYYINMHTTRDPGGAMRSQLYRAETKILMGRIRAADCSGRYSRLQNRESGVELV